MTVSELANAKTTPLDGYCDGHGYDPDSELPNASITAFEVKPSAIPGAGRGVFYKQDFEAGT